MGLEEKEEDGVDEAKLIDIATGSINWDGGEFDYDGFISALLKDFVVVRKPQ